MIKFNTKINEETNLKKVLMFGMIMKKWRNGAYLHTTIFPISLYLSF